MRNHLRIKTIFIFIFIAITSEVTAIISEEAQEETIGFFTNLGNDLTEGFNKFSSDFMSFMDDIGSKLGIEKERLENMDAATMLNKLTHREINSFTLEDWKTMAPGERDKLIDSNKLPTRVQRQLTNLKAQNMTVELARKKLADLDLALSTQLELIKLFPNPKKWSSTDIKKNHDVLFFFPHKILLMVEDQEANKEIFQAMKQCQMNSTEKSKSCVRLLNLDESVMRNQRVVSALKSAYLTKGYGEPNSFTAEILDELDVTRLSPEIIEKISPTVIKDRIHLFLSSDVDFENNAELGTILTAKMIQANNLRNQESAEEVEEILENMDSKLKPFITKRMLPKFSYKNTTVQTILDENLHQRTVNGRLSKIELKFGLREILNKPLTQESVDKYGAAFVSLAPMDKIREALNNSLLTTAQIREYLEKSFRRGNEMKLKEILPNILQDIKTSTIESIAPLSSQNIQSRAAPFLTQSFLNGLSSNAKLAIAKIKAEFSDAQKYALIKENNHQWVDYPPSIKANIPIALLSNVPIEKLDMMASDVPVASVLGDYAMEKKLKGKLNLTAADIDKTIALHMRYGDVSKIELDHLQEVLKKMVNLGVQPMQATCRYLGVRLHELFKRDMGSYYEGDTARLLFPVDVEDTPPCVIASIVGEHLDQLGWDQSILLLNNMKKMHNTLSIPKQVRRVIVTVALKSYLKESGGLSMVELDILGDTVLDTNPAMLRKTRDLESLSLLIDSLNDLLMNPLSPCLDIEDMSAISDIVNHYFKDLTDLETSDVERMCCLLDFLPSCDLHKIPDAVLTSCDCRRDPVVSRFAHMKRVTCLHETNGQIITEERRQQFIDLQEKAMVHMLHDSVGSTKKKKKKRTVSSTIPLCEKIEIQGVTNLPPEDMALITDQDMTTCLAAMGRKKMEEETCSEIKDKLSHAMKGLDKIPEEQVKNLGFILQCFEKEEIQSLPTIDNFETIVQIGKPLGLNKEQLQGLAWNVKMNYKAAKTLTVEDVIALNEVICGFEEPDLLSINNDVFRTSMPTLSKLENCPLSAKRFLMAKAKKVYGPLQKWTSVTVGELGAILGGLTEFDIIDIPPNAMSSLTPGALKVLPPRVSAKLTVPQVKTFPFPTIQSITQLQRSQLSYAVKQAVLNIEDNTLTSSSGRILSSTWGILVIGAVMYF